MIRRVLMMLFPVFLVAAQASAQQRTITGKITSEAGTPLPDVSIIVKGTGTRTTSDAEGNFAIRTSTGQILQFRAIGAAPEEHPVGAADVMNVQLRRVARSLDAVVVTALGQTAAQRALGTSQQSVTGEVVAQTQRENFVTALQGRIAGVDVTTTSGTPGASASIVIRGISSISSSNQPLMILDGLPMDNRTLSTGVLSSDNNATSAFSNRSVDFTNRAADLNAEDIESITVLKGPEAAALYGIDAANGAIVVTTKRGKVGGGFSYNNSLRFEKTDAKLDLQRIWGPNGVLTSPFAATNSFAYFGAPYAPGTVFFDNVDNFLQTGKTLTNNLSFSGATADNRINYRLATSFDNQTGIIPTTDYRRTNITGASQAQINSWLNTDLSMAYTYSNNNQVYKGEIGPLMGLFTWPQTDDAQNFLTPAGSRRKLVSTLGAGTEVDNPYFNVYKNDIESKNSRIIANVGLTLTPVSWGNLKSNIGTDVYTNSNLLLRNPESVVGANFNGLLDLADVIQRNTSIQTLLNFNEHPLGNSFTVSGLIGNSISDFKATTDAATGRDFLDPNFVSLNNTNTRTGKTTVEQRRLVGAFAQASLNFRNYFYLSATGRNDWTSTIPKGRNSFFYPSFSSSFVFSDAFPSVKRFMTGKLRAAVASVGKDARPYAYRPALQYKTTAYGGYGYDFWGPNLDLKPEFKRSREFGAELSFLNDRLGVDATFYRSQTLDQIVNDIRGSYGTGFILFNLNGASTRNKGTEITLRGTPIQMANGFTWDFQANYAKERGMVISLPHLLPESYVSDTWLYGNVRNGTMPGMSTMSLTGLFYLRNNNGDLLIDPTSGLPIRSTSFIDGGYDRQPKYTIGLSNTFRKNKLTLDFLVDIRRGGDIFNATEHYLTARGLSSETLDRDVPRVIKGVLRDGKENSPTPTQNDIVIVPSSQTDYYRLISEELFIQKNINWLRLRDIQVSYMLPKGFLGARNSSVFVKGTDLALWTNYKGLDPLVNGNSAAVGGSGGVGIDFGNVPVPKGVNFGVRLDF